MLHVDSQENEQNLQFSVPSKTKGGVYLAKINKPVLFRLPEMDVLSVVEEQLDGSSATQNMVYKYLIDLENNACQKLLKFLYNLDSIAIQAAERESLKWFGRCLSRTAVQEKYIPPYDTDVNDDLFLRVQVSTEVQKKFKHFNFEQPHYAVMSIEGLHFYKNNFVYSLQVTKFMKLKSNGINDEMIDVLADYEDSSSSRSQEDIFMYRTTGNPVETRMSKFEIESIVDQKKRELDRFFVEAEKAQRFAETLRLKAMQKANELKNIESLLESESNLTPN